MFIPTKDAIFEMTPTEFEKCSLEILKEQTKNLENVKVVHNRVVKAPDGNYQIDGYIEFEAMGMLYKTIVECKHYSHPISREIIQKVYDNLRAIGAHKGIVISTSNFQSGARVYAEAHGIALIQIIGTDNDFPLKRGMSVLVNHPYTPTNNGRPYIGVLQRQREVGGITCEYLGPYSTALAKFLCSEIKNNI